MITVNGRHYKGYEGITIKELLLRLNYTYPVLIVIVGDRHIKDEEYGSVIIKNGDNIRVIHPVCGG